MRYDRSGTAKWIVFLLSAAARAESSPDPVVPLTPSPFNEERILGIMPNFQTVSDPDRAFVPLTPKQKWALAAKATLDPFNLASAAMGAGFSQMGNQTPKYGWGGGAYGARYGAAFADFATQNLFSAGVLANLLHQDPRYFRKGPRSSIPARLAYSVSRLAIARNDAGKQVFNASGIFGMGLGIAASNLYYPSSSVSGEVMAGRLSTSLLGGIIGNLTSEFWPDIQRSFFHRQRRQRSE